jgi:hypothetical protein
MPYVPNAVDTTEPLSSQTVESAALEFRTLKTSINSRVSALQTEVDAEEVARAAADAALDVRVDAIEAALPTIGAGGLPGTVYVQRLSGTGAQVAYTLSITPQGNNVVDIYIQGIYQQKNTFSVAGNVLTFSEAPIAGTNNIEVQITATIALGSTDSSLVDYIPAGTGAVATTVQTKLRETVSVKDFGAVGDGVTDDTAAINAALTALVAGGTLLFPPGTYKVTSTINKTFNNGAMVNLVGYGAKIDGTSVVGSVAGDTTLVTLGGARLTGVALGTSASKYATSITTATAISAAVNDIALITSSDLWNPTRAYYYKGEFIEMRGISGTTIDCHTALFDSYTNSTTTVYALSMPTVVVEGLEVVMNANQTALVVAYSRNPTIRNTKVHGARYTGIEFKYCFGGSIENNEVYDAWYSGTGTSYCVGVATCQNVVVNGNNLTEARHCITGGGWEPCRNVIYSNNVCTVHPSEPTTNAIDQHGNMEFCSILGNVANGGITISSINAVIKNNIVTDYRAVTQAILVYQEINSDFYDISGNSILTNGTVYGIYYTPVVASISTDRVLFHDNNIKSGGRAISMQPRNNTITGHTIGKVSVKNNLLNSTGASQVCFYHGVTGAASFTTTLFDSASNVFKSDLYDAFSVQGSVASSFSTNDKFYCNRLNGYISEFAGVDATYVNPYFEGNTGGAGNSRSVYYANTGTVRCINPVFKNMSFKAELAAAGPTLYIEQGWYSATPTVNNAAGARLVNFYGALGRAIGYGTAAPTTGTWAVGDRVYSQSPSVGNPKSWVCTVAGTPGTWVSEGNL